MREILFVNPCGISLISNYLGNDFKNRFGTNIYSFSNYTKRDFENDKQSIEKFHYFEKKLSELEEKLLTMDEEKLKKLSAELNGILTYLKDKNIESYVQHILIPTDTYFGEKVSQILKNVLEKRFKHIVIFSEPVRDLRTSSLEEFHWALKDLASKLLRDLELEKFRERFEIIFNLTGGFKSVNSFLQVMATLYADKSIYIFEASRELLTIPRLPIKVDYSIFEKYLDFFRKLELSEKYKIWINIDIPEDIPESIVISLNGEISLSPYGEILWAKAKRKIYKEKLVKPLTDKLLYSNDFERQFSKLSLEDRWSLNRSLDDLNLYLLSNGQYNPRSLRFHPLKNHPKYDFEFYPFEGNDSRRCYIKQKGDRFEIISIDDHL